MAKQKRTKVKLCDDNVSILYLLYYFGYGIMFIFQLESIMDYLMNKPKSTLRDEINRMIEAGILEQIRINGRYCVRIRQYGIDYLVKHVGHFEYLKYAWSKKCATKITDRALIKSVLANGYLLIRLGNYLNKVSVNDVSAVLAGSIMTSSLYYRDGYNNYALSLYLLKHDSLLGQEVKDWFVSDMEFQKKLVEASVMRLNKEQSEEKNYFDKILSLPTDLTLCTLSKKYVYLWNAKTHQINNGLLMTCVEMVILDIYTYSPPKIIELLAECQKFCDRYFGRGRIGRYELVVDVVVDSEERANCLSNGVNKKIKARKGPVILESTKCNIIPAMGRGFNHPIV